MADIHCKECGAHKLSPTQTDDKLWDGYLQLNSTPTISAVAFFEGGEKMPDVKWSRSIVVKGTVKIQDFEKYIQELPLSRNKELMVVSLYCKQESSQVGLEGMEKVAKKYVEDGRVGLAKVITGIDLYVCPPSETIITILEKYGYLDGTTHFKENKDSLIGCVVWRRNQINHLNSVQKSSRKNDHVQVRSPISTPSERSRKKDHTVWSPIRSPSKWSRKNYPTVCSPIRTSSESSRKNDPTVWSSIRTSPESSRKNDPTVWSPIRTSSESSRKNDPVVWSLIRTPSETWRKISPVWSPIRWPLESSTEGDQVQQRDSVETGKNGNITPQPHISFRTYYYSDLIKSEDAAIESSHVDLDSKEVGRELVPVVTAVTKQSSPSAILHNESEDDLPKYKFGTSPKRRLDDITEQSSSFVILQKELEDDLPEFDFGTSTSTYPTLQKKSLDAAAKQTLSFGILRKELEDDLPEYEFGTLNTSCQNLEKRRWEESMEQDMDISPEQSPQKKVCRIDENSNMSSITTLFADAPPMSPVNASWYPSVQYMNQLNAQVTQEASNIPHFTYLGSVSNLVQQNLIPPASTFQIHPPFQTLKPDFTYLGSVSSSMQQNFIPSPSAFQIHPPFQTLNPDFTYPGPRPHAHSHVHAKPRRNDVRVGRDHMTEFNQNFTFNPQKAANKQYQSPGQ